MIWISITPIISVHFPRALSFTPILLGLIMSAWWVLVKKETLIHSKAYMFCIIGICALCIISSLWSIEPMEAYKKSLKISAILILSIPLFNIATTIKAETLKPYLWLLPAGVTLAATLSSFELIFDLPIYKTIRNIEPSHNISSAVMNRGIVAIIFAYFASMLFIKNIDSIKTRIILNIAMNISVITMLLLTQSQSAQLAYASGILALLLPHGHKLTHKSIAIAIIIALIITPFITGILYSLLIENAQELPWLKDAYAGNRVEIWHFVMNYALHSPLYGYGIEATRFVTNFEHDYIYHTGSTILHPHNFAIQIWMEFGAIGIISASALIYFIMLEISKLSLIEKQFTTVTVIAVLVVSSVGYGTWQSWWIGELIFINALCACIIKRADFTGSSRHLN